MDRMERFLACVAIYMWATVAVHAEDEYIYWIAAGISSGRPLVTESDGKTVARMTTPEGVLLPGYSRGSSYISSIGGQRYIARNNDFEVLVYMEEQGRSLVWVARDSVEGVPSGAVIGGRTVDGYPLYIIRGSASHSSGIESCIGNYDTRNNFCEMYCWDARQLIVFDFLVQVYETVVIMGDHMNPWMLINRRDGSTRAMQSSLNDPQNNTCVHMEMASSMLLQAVFSFPAYSSNQQMSVQVKLRHTEGACTSATWDWFVESECAAGSFRECDRQLVSVATPYTYCKITCQCLFACDFLYVKSYYIPRGTLEYEICDVKLPYATMEPGVGQ